MNYEAQHPPLHYFLYAGFIIPRFHLNHLIDLYSPARIGSYLQRLSINKPSFLAPRVIGICMIVCLAHSSGADTLKVTVVVSASEIGKNVPYSRTSRLKRMISNSSLRSKNRVGCQGFFLEPCRYSDKM
jgi:hypothetical protein